MLAKIKLVFFIIKNIFKGDDFIMAMLYATLVIKGLRTFSSIPVTLKAQVAQILIDADCAYLIDDPAYQPQQP